jgi:hypothetical protein
MPVGAQNGGAQDLGHQAVLGQAGFGHFQDLVVHRLDDAGGAAHALDLGPRFHRALPVDQGGGVDDRGLRQVFDQDGMGLGGVIVPLELDADHPASQPFSASRAASVSIGCLSSFWT